MLPEESWSPGFELSNCQINVELDTEVLSLAIPRAFCEVSRSPSGSEPSLMASLGHLEISILDDAEIARIHDEQMGDPTATDVITFQHGELLISADTAQREAMSRKWPVERELLLYIVHGLLHLHGYDDLTPDLREAMHAQQDAILDRLWPLKASD